MRNVNKVVKALIDADAHHATKFFAYNHVVRATRILYRGKIDKRGRSIDIRLTIGRPNYAERKFVKKVLAAGKPFPVSKVQLKFPAKKR